MAEPLDKIWRGKAWSDGSPVTRVPQPDGSTAEGTAAYAYAWNANTGQYAPLKVDPATGGLQIGPASGTPQVIPSPPPQVNKEALDKHWKGKAWNDGAPVTRVPQADGSISEGQAALAYAWNDSTQTYSRLPIDPVTGALQVVAVGGATVPGPMGPPGPSVASYVLTISGGTVTATAGRSGLGSFSGADAGAVLQSCITALGVGGGRIVFQAGTYPWSSVPGIPPGITGRLVIQGEGRDAVKITLSAAGPRFLDFNRTADYQTFQNVEITDLTVDCNNVGGKHHVVIGGYVNGAIPTRINIQNIALQRVRTINVPVDSTTTIHRLNVYLFSQHLAAGEATQNVIQDILVEDCRFEGGNAGVSVGGSGTVTNVNVFVDRVTIRRCWHSLLAVQGTGFSSGNYFVGSRGFGGSVLIESCYGQYSGDVGVEVDSMTDATVRNTVVEDAVNANFFHTQFATPQYPNKQVIVFDTCASRRLLATSSRGFSFRTSTVGIGFGTQIVKNCSHYHGDAGFYQTGEALYRADDGGAVSGVPHTNLVVEDFTIDIENIAYSSATVVTRSLIQISPTAASGIATIRLRNISVRLSGASTGGATLTLVMLSVWGTSLDLVLDGLNIDATGFTGLGTSGLRAMHFGPDGTGITLQTSAVIKGVRYINAGDMSAGFGINMNAAGLAIGAGRYVFVEDCDFQRTSMTAANAISILTANKAQTIAKKITWKTPPAPVALSGLTSGVGAALATGWPCIAQFVQGTGAGITAVDFSTNGGTTWVNLLTQASGAMPAGADATVGPLPPDAQVRVTFATTQPTINLVPALY